MSIAPSIPSIKVRISTPHRLPTRPFTTIRSSNAEGPLRRPAAPLSSPPTIYSSAPPLSPPAPPAPAQSPPKPFEAATSSKEAVVTLEYQRKVAKELQDYFKQKKLEEANQAPFFGFLPKNEISNGRLNRTANVTQMDVIAVADDVTILVDIWPTHWRRTIWAMFGFAVGLLTEYATGASFVQQLKILLSNFGIVDLE